MTSEEQIAAAVTACTDAFGSLDFWVNNAGITRDKTLRNMTLDDFRQVIDVHLVGGWLGTRAAAAVMREQGRGGDGQHLLISGKVGNPGPDELLGGEGGPVGLTKAAAKELGATGSGSTPCSPASSAPA